MSVQELIERLQELPSDATVVFEVNGEATRTGDFIRADGVRSLILRDTTYGGADEDTGEHNPEFNSPDTYEAVLIK